MTKLRAWLATEVLRVRGFSIRRLHGVGLLIAIAVALILVFAAGVFVGYQYPYRTVAPPKIPPGQTAPNSTSCPHTMGGCLPKPTLENQAAITSTKQGPDLSNNNAVPGRAAWAAIAKHSAFAIFKVSEGTGFADQTAEGMTQQAKATHLVVGGYDFLHVCLDSAATEAHFFVLALRRDGLTGAGTLPPVGDAEYPGSPACNVRAWLTAWARAVHAELGVWPMVYTGAWWWNPHVGSWWLAHALAWVSGYTSWPPPFPAGRNQIDLWQFTDHGFNGATTGDLSVWRDGVTAFTKLTGAKPPTVNVYAIYLNRPITLHHVKLVERRVVARWDRQKCRNPARRGVCKVTRRELLWLRGRIDYVAHHPLRHHKPTYSRFNRGERRAGISRRLAQR